MIEGLRRIDVYFGRSRPNLGSPITSLLHPPSTALLTRQRVLFPRTITELRHSPCNNYDDATVDEQVNQSHRFDRSGKKNSDGYKYLDDCLVDFHISLPYYHFATKVTVLLYTTITRTPHEDIFLNMTKRNLIHAVALSDSSSKNGINWVISVQPKTIHKWFSTHNPSAVIFGSHGIINDVHPSALLVKVLLGENDYNSITHSIQEVLQRIHTSDPDTFLHEAVEALQHADLITQFDISEFTATVTKTLLQEQSGQHTGPVEIDHEGHPIRRASAGLEESVAAMKHKEKKKGMGFWVSTGPNYQLNNARKHQHRESWERQDDAYGGLM